MNKILTPTHYVGDVYKININYLAQQGIKLAIFDLDNTLATSDQHKAPARVKTLFKKFEAAGITAIIMSNNSRKRVAKFCQKWNVYWIALSCKPLAFSFKKAMKHFKIKNKKSIVMIGDQIMTDIIFANINGARSVLVKPISLESDSKITSFNRRLERKTLALVKHDKKIDNVKILRGK